MLKAYKDLLDSINEGNLDLVKNLPNKKNIDSDNLYNQNNGYALVLASKKNKPDIVSFLLNYISSDINNNFPLKISCELGHIECVKVLLPHFEESKNQSDLSSIIYWTTYQKQFEVLKYLISNTKQEISTSTMILSMSKNYPEAIDLLFDRIDRDKIMKKIKSSNMSGPGFDYFKNKVKKSSLKFKS